MVIRIHIAGVDYLDVGGACMVFFINVFGDIVLPKKT